MKISAAEKLRQKLEVELEQLQQGCSHEKSSWMDCEWAPGHSSGGVVLVCDECEKILDRSPKEIKWRL